MATSTPPPRRVMLWAAPRTLSTVFQKCMSFVDGVQVINEPHVSASSFGPERRIIPAKVIEKMRDDLDAEVKEHDDLDAPLAFDENICTYDWVKKTLEADYPGKKLVFCKDMAVSVDLEAKYDKLPEGFRHTFIIRDPLKVFKSFRKLYFRMMNLPEEQLKSFRLTDLPPDTLPPKHMFGEMVDLLHYLKEHQMESNPVVIDADDLLSNPESILRQYFEAIEVPFSDDLLQWEAGDGVLYKWIACRRILKANKLDPGRFYCHALSSSQFEAPKNSAPDESELTYDVVELAKAADKYYKELYEMRLKP